MKYFHSSVGVGVCGGARVSAGWFWSTGVSVSVCICRVDIVVNMSSSIPSVFQVVCLVFLSLLSVILIFNMVAFISLRLQGVFGHLGARSVGVGEISVSG